MTWNLSELDGLTINRRKAADKQTCVWLFHGYGANEYDLAGVAEVLDPDAKLSWYLPQGIHALGVGPYMIGRSWFDLDVPTIQGSIARGDTDFLAQKISPALAQTTEYLLPKVESISSEYDEVILAGFSQGSFVAFDLMLSMLTNTNMAKKVTKAMLLSSTMARPKVWAEKIANLNGQKIFQSHGLQDPVLPLQGAESLKTALEASNAEYKYLGFAGGHEVPMEVLGAAGSFLQFH